MEYALDFSADGRRLVAAVDQLDAVTGVSERTFATVWDLADPSRPVFRMRLPDYPVLKLSPDGQRLYVAAGCCAWTPRRWDRLEYSHDGSRLAAATGNGNVVGWDTTTAAPLHRFVEGGSSWGLAFSPTTGLSTAPGTS